MLFYVFSQGYQFWTEADANGYFMIKDIRPGSYNLYAWVPGVIGDYRYDVSINVNSGFDSATIKLSLCCLGYVRKWGKKGKEKENNFHSYSVWFPILVRKESK